MQDTVVLYLVMIVVYFCLDQWRGWKSLDRLEAYGREVGSASMFMTFGAIVTVIAQSLTMHARFLEISSMVVVVFLRQVLSIVFAFAELVAIDGCVREFMHERKLRSFVGIMLIAILITGYNVMMDNYVSRTSAREAENKREQSYSSPLYAKRDSTIANIGVSAEIGALETAITAQKAEINRRKLELDKIKPWHFPHDSTRVRYQAARQQAETALQAAKDRLVEIERDRGTQLKERRQEVHNDFTGRIATATAEREKSWLTRLLDPIFHTMVEQFGFIFVLCVWSFKWGAVRSAQEYRKRQNDAPASSQVANTPTVAPIPPELEKATASMQAIAENLNHGLNALFEKIEAQNRKIDALAQVRTGPAPSGVGVEVERARVFVQGDFSKRNGDNFSNADVVNTAGLDDFMSGRRRTEARPRQVNGKDVRYVPVLASPQQKQEGKDELEAVARKFAAMTKEDRRGKQIEAAEELAATGKYRDQDGNPLSKAAMAVKLSRAIDKAESEISRETE